ncbi:MAG: methyltransferase domain-containing protein [Motiliproteus sp.]
MTTVSGSLCCPLCQHSLSLQTPCGKSLSCDNGHSFDRARQGYYHLLPVQQKRSRDPGDDAAMVNGRQQFLDKGHYQPLSDSINALLLKHLEQPSLQILDCGCGEGYYSARLEQSLSDNAWASELIGVDISKHAVKAACRRSRTINWLVASSRQLPVAPHSQDALLSLFAPVSKTMFTQTLKPSGLLLLATTGSEHLLQLRQQIYSQVRQESHDPLAELAPEFELIEQQSVQYRFMLNDSESIMQLLGMTPHQWRADGDARQRLQQLQQLELDLDVKLHLLRTNGS